MAAFLSGCANQENQKEFESNKEKTEINNLQEERRVKEESLKSDLIKKYNPIIFEDSNFSFSKDIQDKTDNHFLLKGEVHDLYQKEDKNFIQLNSFLYPDYVGVFEINDDQLNFIKTNLGGDNFFSEVFAIVKINDVSKPLFKVEGNIDVDAVDINEASSDMFLFKGVLIDIKKID